MAFAYEMRRDRPIPSGLVEEAHSAWCVYIDDLNHGETVPSADVAALAGTRSPGMAAADERYLAWRVPGSDEKSVNRAVRLTKTGAAQLQRRLGVTDWDR